MNTSQPRARWKPAAAETDAPAEAWQAQGVGVGPARWRGRSWVRLGIALLFFAGFLALLIYVAFWLSPAKGTAVVLISTGYEDNLAVPHNVYGQRGLDALAKFIDAHGAAVGLHLHKKKEP